jgi:hypothetical protein
MSDSIAINISTLKEVVIKKEECYCVYLENGWNGKCNACQNYNKQEKMKKEVELVEEVKALQNKLHETRDPKYFYQDDNWKGRIIGKLLRKLWIC